MSGQFTTESGAGGVNTAGAGGSSGGAGDLAHALTQGTPYGELPPALRQRLTQQEYHLRLLRHAVLRYHSHARLPTFLRERVTEREYYTFMMQHAAQEMQLYPYMYQREVLEHTGVTPLSYYREMVAEMLRKELSYDRLPNFTAIDVLKLLGIGRNQYLNLTKEVRSTLRWHMNRTYVIDHMPREFLPSAEVQPLWAVHAAPVSPEALRRALDAPEPTPVSPLNVMAMTFGRREAPPAPPLSLNRNAAEPPSQAGEGDDSAAPSNTGESSGSGPPYHPEDAVLYKMLLTHRLPPSLSRRPGTSHGALEPEVAAALDMAHPRRTIAHDPVYACELPRAALTRLFRRGLVCCAAALGGDDRIVVPPLTQFVMNRTSDQPMELLLYRVLSTTDDQTPLRMLAQLLATPEEDVCGAATVLVRLGLAQLRTVSIPDRLLEYAGAEQVRAAEAAAAAASSGGGAAGGSASSAEATGEPTTNQDSPPPSASVTSADNSGSTRDAASESKRAVGADDSASGSASGGGGGATPNVPTFLEQLVLLAHPTWRDAVRALVHAWDVQQRSLGGANNGNSKNNNANNTNLASASGNDYSCYNGSSTGGAAEDARAGSIPTDTLTDGVVLPGDGSGSGGGSGGGGGHVRPKKIALLYDATLTGFLMMTNLSRDPLFKQHAVTLFEVGKMPDEMVQSFIKLLDQINPGDAAAHFGGEALSYVNSALCLRALLRALRYSEAVTAPDTRRPSGLDLLKIESLNELEAATRHTLLTRNYWAYVCVSPVAVAPLIDLRLPGVYGSTVGLMASPWLMMYMYQRTKKGPPALLLPFGNILQCWPPVFYDAEEARAAELRLQQQQQQQEEEETLKNHEGTGQANSEEDGRGSDGSSHTHHQQPPASPTQGALPRCSAIAGCASLVRLQGLSLDAEVNYMDLHTSLLLVNETTATAPLMVQCAPRLPLRAGPEPGSPPQVLPGWGYREITVPFTATAAEALELARLAFCPDANGRNTKDSDTNRGAGESGSAEGETGQGTAHATTTSSDSPASAADANKTTPSVSVSVADDDDLLYQSFRPTVEALSLQDSLGYFKICLVYESVTRVVPANSTVTPLTCPAAAAATSSSAAAMHVDPVTGGATEATTTAEAANTSDKAKTTTAAEAQPRQEQSPEATSHDDDRGIAAVTAAAATAEVGAASPSDSSTATAAKAGSPPLTLPSSGAEHNNNSSSSSNQNKSACHNTETVTVVHVREAVLASVGLGVPLPSADCCALMVRTLPRLLTPESGARHDAAMRALADDFGAFLERHSALTQAARARMAEQTSVSSGPMTQQHLRPMAVSGAPYPTVALLFDGSAVTAVDDADPLSEQW